MLTFPQVFQPLDTEKQKKYVKRIMFKYLNLATDYSNLIVQNNVHDVNWYSNATADKLMA